MKQFWLVLAVQANMVFFAVLSVLGLVYTGSEESNSYVYFCGLTAAIAMIIVIMNEARMHNKRSTFMYFVPIVVYLIEFLRISGMYSEVPNLNRNALIFFCYSVPAIYVGTYLANSDGFNKSRKWFDLFMFILSIGLVFSLRNIRSSQLVSMSGGTYQAFSYIAAFCFGINLYGILENEYQRPSLLWSIILKVIRIILLVVQIICVFLGGGRGAAVLMVITPFVLLRIKGVHYFKLLVYLICVIPVVLFAIRRLDNSTAELFEYGINRSFSYITVDGFNFEEASGRNLVYEEAIKSFQERPLLGYGLLGYLVPDNYYYGYSPHNFFLEVLLQGGVLFLIFVISVFAYLFLKLKRIIRFDPRCALLIPLALYPCVSLQFSGDYLSSPLFWFCTSYIIAFDESQTIIN